MPRIEIPFEVIGWEPGESGVPGAGPEVARATVKKTFRGVLAGESTAGLLMCAVDAKNLAAGAGYVAMERFVGTLSGRTGTFVYQHVGLGGPGIEPSTDGHIVPGTGTGELAGITGTAEIRTDGGHRLILDYELP